MIWILFAVITASVILAVARPLNRAAATASGSSSEIEAYKLQLAELARDEELGGIGKDEAAQTRAEISRRLLKASREGASAAFSGEPIAFNTNYAFAGLAAFIAVGAAGLYALYGNPGLADQPLEARLSAPPSEQPLSIQMANIEHRLRTNPDDATGWTLIAPLYFRTGQFDNAAQAYQQAIRLGGADEDKLLGLFEAMTYAAEGTIPAEAKPILDRALLKNPQSLRGRTWHAIWYAQDGKKAEAERIYREMLSENPSAEWRGIIFRQLSGLKDQPDAPKKELAQSSGGAAPMAAGGGKDLPSVDVLVERLAARLKQNPAELGGWLMLIRSYSALNEAEKKEDAIAQARKQFAGDAQALSQIDAVLKELGPNVSKAPGSSAAAPAAAPVGDAPSGDQSGMIRGMVDRLAGKLKQNPADLNGWLMLIRSYTALKQPAEAQEAAASARKQFASEPEALSKIDALQKELGGAGAAAPAESEAKAPAAAAPAAEAPAGDQSAMIRGMVGKLAGRLKENPADRDGWLMLIRSYSVLKDMDKAKEAAADARKQFASDAEALEKIETLSRELGLEAAGGKEEQPK
jgi:cytochrome c-type biogenesis protein CcmH